MSVSPEELCHFLIVHTADFVGQLNGGVPVGLVGMCVFEFGICKAILTFPNLVQVKK